MCGQKTPKSRLLKSIYFIHKTAGSKLPCGLSARKFCYAMPAGKQLPDVSQGLITFILVVNQARKSGISKEFSATPL
jgi:hypothetical protein